MIGVLSFSSAAVKSECIFLLRTEFVSDIPDSGSWGMRTLSFCGVHHEKTTDYQVHLKRTSFSLWCKNVQPFGVRMGPKNLPAPSSFPCVEVVTRGCQHQLGGGWSSCVTPSRV